MAIISSGIWDIDPTVTDGTQLAGYLNELVAAINTNQSSATRPPMIKKGGLWTKTLSGSDIAVMVYDGTTDYEIGKIVGGDIQLDSIWTEVGDVATYDGDIAWGSEGNGKIWSDNNWGCIFTADKTNPNIAEFMWENSDGTDRMQIDTTGSLSTTQDITVNGITVGKGKGSVATNTVVSTSALTKNTTGENNTAIGASALRENTEGVSNVAVGVGSLSLNNKGVNNSGVGLSSLSKNTTGGNNSAMGGQALFHNIGGDFNTAMGVSALFNSSVGSRNSALGSSAGNTLTTGSNNTLIGYNAQPSSATVSNEITIGDQYVTKTRVKGMLDVTTGGHRFTIDNNYDGACKIFTAKDIRFYIGSESVYRHTFQSNNSAFAFGMNPGNGYIAAFSGSTNNGLASYRAITGLGGIHHFHSDDGAVNKLKSYINGTGSLTQVSGFDSRTIENAKPIKSALDKVNKLKPITYTHKDSKSKGIGFVAHELQEVISEAVVGKKDQKKKDGKPFYQGVDITKVIPYLTKAVQELSEKNKLIDKLEARLQNIEEQLKKQKK